jgi:hypothetical protein
MVATSMKTLVSKSYGGSGADPSGPIWLLMKAQPNYGPVGMAPLFRDGAWRALHFHERDTMDVENIKDGADEIKADVYETMGVINRSFAQITASLYKLESIGVLAKDYAYSQETPIREMAAKINCYVISKVTERELDDRNHYSRMRANQERKRK